MAQKMLNSAQLLAGALLKFTSVSYITLKLLIEDFKHKYPNVEFEEKTIYELQNFIRLKNCQFVLSTNDNAIIQKQQLIEMAGPYIKNYFETFNIKYFTLKKIEALSPVIVEELDIQFSKTEQKIIKQLAQGGYLYIQTNEKPEYEDYTTIELSTLGILKLFQQKYHNEITIFHNKIESLSYPSEALDFFLMQQDLSNSSLEILDLEKFEYFYFKYNKYIPLIYDENDNLNETSAQLLKELLVATDTNNVYLCQIYIKDDDINVNWNSINISKILKYNNPRNIQITDCENQLSYYYRYGLIPTSTDDTPQYNIIIEQNSTGYIARGIIKANNNQISIIFNPKYKIINGDEHQNPQILTKKV